MAGFLLAGALLISAPASVVIPAGAAEAAIAPASLTGVHGSEENYGRQIRWTDGHARLVWPRVFGVLPVAAEISLGSFPGRAGDQVTVTVNGRHVARHVLSADWDVFTVPVTAGDGALTLDIQTLSRHAPGDPRPLGARLERVTLKNARLGAVLAGTAWWHVLLLLFAGAGAWSTGRWVASEAVSPASARATVNAAGAAAVLGLFVLLWWCRALLLGPGGLAALGGGAALGGYVVLRLRQAGVRRGMSVVVGLGVGSVFVTLILLALQYFVDVPRWDVWELVPLIHKQHDGTLRLADLWAGHNMHRPMSARVLLLANVTLTRWNHWVDLGMLLALAALHVAVLTAFVARTQRCASRVPPASLIALALLMCTTAQWENWLQGWQVSVLIGSLGVMTTLLLLTNARTSWLAVGAAGLSATTAMASFASGLLAWPLGVVAITMSRQPGWQSRALAWTAWSIVALVVYFVDLPRDASASGMGALLTQDGARRFVAGILVAIAMPVFYRPESFSGPAGTLEMVIVSVGAAACVLAAILVLLRWRTSQREDASWVFPALLCMFGIGSSAMAAAGRVQLAMHAMTASRYVVFAACFWAGLILLLMARSTAHTRVRRWASGAIVVAVVASTAEGAWHALRYMDAHHLSSSQAREALRRGDVHAASFVLYPNGPELDRRQQLLHDYRLSVFRPGAR